MKSRRSAGFTLVEMLIVISIIGFLATLLYSAIGRVVKQARIHNTYVCVKNLETACRQYYVEYGQWPGVGYSNQMDGTFMSMLQGSNVAGGSCQIPNINGLGGNPKQYTFMQATATNSDGSLTVPINPAAKFWVTFNTLTPASFLYRPDLVAGTNPVENSAGILVWAINPLGRTNDPNNTSTQFIGSWK